MSDTIASIIQTAQNINSEENHAFVDKFNWFNPDDLDQKLHVYIAPHSKPYFSPFRPIFLFEIKDLFFIKCFSSLLARDGILSTLNFFYRFPSPGSLKTTILINKKFAYLVPFAWKKNIAFYQTFVAHARKDVLKSPKGIYLTTLLDKEQCSLDYLSQQLIKIKEKYEGQLDTIPVFCLFLNPLLVGEEDVEKDDGHYFQVCKMVFQHLGSNVHYSKWDDFIQHDLQETVFLDLNEDDYHYTDSFVLFHFLRNGAIPLNYEDFATNVNSASVINLSPYHGLELSLDFPNDYEEKQSRIQNEIDDLKRFVLKGEDKLLRESQNFKNVHLCSDEFRSFAKDIMAIIN